MKYYFYAPSFVTLREYLYLKTLYQDIIMVTLNPGLIDVAKLMKWDLIAFPLYDNSVLNVKSPIARKIHTLKYFNNVNKRINKQIVQAVQKGMFFSSCLLIDLWGIKIVKQIARLRKDVNVVYLNDYEVTSRFKKIKNLPLNRLVQQIKTSLLFGTRLGWYDTGCGEYLGVDINRFTKKYGIENKKSAEAFYSKTNYDNIDIDLEPIQCLILGNCGIDDNKTIVSTESIKKVYNFIKKIIPDAYHKYHPGRIFHDELSDSFKQAPSVIPVEFLHKKIKIAIGDFSSALTTLSFMGVKCISYLKLLDTYSNFDKDFWIKRMTKDSIGKIIFVNTFAELENLIRN